jgi:hypothetical protein
MHSRAPSPTPTRTRARTRRQPFIFLVAAAPHHESRCWRSIAAYGVQILPRILNPLKLWYIWIFKSLESRGRFRFAAACAVRNPGNYPHALTWREARADIGLEIRCAAQASRLPMRAPMVSPEASCCLTCVTSIFCICEGPGRTVATASTDIVDEGV